MSNMLNFKGYYGSVEFSIEDGVLHGKIQCINDVVTYEAETIPALQIAFEEAVTDYLETCAELGREADKTMSGSFNIRIGQHLHKKAFLAACHAGQSLNDFVKSAVEEKLSNKKEFHFHFEQKEVTKTQSHSFVTSSQADLKWTGFIEKDKRIHH
ncbi:MULTISPECIES: type II toxin-antitoxin system HicB family antitoxin [Serratia]|uniref:type II toxin-antitoxin system HicB family antitoxin n=1 Tax=Serratia TaxID=613 RepID=UPI0014955A07|nr:type II toxin-antitoxin system HicB family antitoxin [Serratia marcescens]HAT4981061.1 type II toxin-antitoxin system HicB family antitoxin [Serratia marcescens]HBB7109452.1 type II toxin-antitoxin system HicB family antitoxin [Serratia marcescens]HBC2511408.1 type II toxin-antitoxin system HicB family antitoxin [Serratia marcescens]HBC2523624.1 type II toxin-antitoxin system HicB family antitoxin [Serratia marcescens]HBC2527949.1 type II toxin-antitoxin system HicB family antitoxin [Serrat